MARNSFDNSDSGCNVRGSLIAIGGHEQKEGERPILKELAKQAGDGRLIVATIASEDPQPQWEEYRQVFTDLGVEDVRQLDVRRREEMLIDTRLELFENAKVVFFAGGDQRKITSRFGGTPLCQLLQQLYRDGLTVAGTSSGASVLSEVMMAAGEADASTEVGGSLRLAPGLGLITGVVIDQHFAERGRMGRLLGAVAQNPRVLGIGIDEDTAVLIHANRELTAIGSGGVYVVDAHEMTYTNAARDTSSVMSAFGMRLHVLSAGDSFDLGARQPAAAPELVGREG